jgi:hypothetical protein
MPDHVHMCISIPLKYSVLSVVGYLKVKSVYFDSLGIDAMNTFLSKTTIWTIFIICSAASIGLYFFHKNTELTHVDGSVISPHGISSNNYFTSPTINEPGEYRVENMRHGVGTIIEAPYKQKLSSLRKQADSGNTRAVCQLAWVLDVCAREQHALLVSSMWNSINTIEKNNIREIELIQKKLMASEAVNIACKGFEVSDYADSDKRMLDAAKIGSVKSMTRFALMTPRYGSSPDISDESFLKSYESNAVLFLNRAAESGDREALLGIYRAYRFGYINNAWGDVQVGEDLAKAVAAAAILSVDAAPEDANELNQFIFDSKAAMSSDQMGRSAELEAAYRKNYQFGLNQDSNEFASTDPMRVSDCDKSLP